MSLSNKLKTKRTAQTNMSHIIGQNIKQLRELHHMTQEDIAIKLGISYQQVQKYEAGKNRISIESLMVLKQLYDVPYDFFLRQKKHHPNSIEERSELLGMHISSLLKKVKTQNEQQKILKVVDILCS